MSRGPAEEVAMASEAEEGAVQFLETPIPKRVRIMDHIVDRLTNLIVEGKLEPGRVIRQETIARQLGVSRTPLREALQRLELDGLVVVSPSGAARVASYDLDEALEMMDVREVVDGLAARVLAERGLTARVDAELADLVEPEAIRKSVQPHWTWERCMDDFRSLLDHAASS